MSRASLPAAILLYSVVLLAGKPTQTYVMVSGWALYPPPDTDPALRTALKAIGKAQIFGIAYGTLGVPPQIRSRAHLPDDFDPNAYNRKLFRLAKDNGANLWLQLRYYDNWIDGQHLTAPQILSEPAAARAFLQSARAALREYHDAYPKGCTVILGEEETMYHAKDGGGLFWAGQKTWDLSAKDASQEHLRLSTALDEAFVNNYAGINRLLIGEIRRAYPDCRVGVHIGHAPLYRSIEDKSLYEMILSKLRPLKIDFTFYDLYGKVSKTDAEFRQKLTDRVTILKKLGQPVYYLAQLHTTNNFGSGGGRTPSAREIDETADLARQLGVDGFGYYTKNAVASLCTPSKTLPPACNAEEDRDPLDPNSVGQTMVWQSSPRRWEYGLKKLASFRP